MTTGSEQRRCDYARQRVVNGECRTIRRGVVRAGAAPDQSFPAEQLNYDRKPSRSRLEDGTAEAQRLAVLWDASNGT